MPPKAPFFLHILAVATGLLGCAGHQVQAGEGAGDMLSGTLVAGVRGIDESEAGFDRQYRLSWAPSVHLGEGDSLHMFAATGDDFSSVNNSFGAKADINVRRMFLRSEGDRGRVEVGVIPPFKGRVSSTGLSGDGWIKGARGVVDFGGGKLEAVLGELDDLSASRAMALPDSLNYFEVEYSASMTGGWDYEIAADRLLEANFARGEVRHRLAGGAIVAMELIGNLSAGEAKAVLSCEGGFQVAGRRLDFFAFYSYADREFGARAELNEDFVEFGHSIALELEGPVNRWLRWIGAMEIYEGRTLLKLELRATHEH